MTSTRMSFDVRLLSTLLRCFLLAMMVVLSAVARAAESPERGPRVIGAIGSRTDGSAGLGDWLTVQVQDAGVFLDGIGGDCRSVVLFLSDAAVPDLPPETCDRQRGTIRFLLDRDPENAASNHAWHRLLGRPDRAWRPVAVSVGTSRRLMLPTDVHAFHLFVVPAARLASFLTFLVLTAGLLIVLVRRTSLIRRSGSGRSGPYSLARLQMAFWSYLILASFVFLWLMTSEVDTINGTALMLLGINGGAGIAAWMIDSSRSPTSRQSRGLFIDVLSDDDSGITVHRFQALAWTFVLGIIFTVTLYRTLFMPEFSPMLLGLLGMSQATYVGMKIPNVGATA